MKFETTYNYKGDLYNIKFKVYFGCVRGDYYEPPAPTEVYLLEAYRVDTAEQADDDLLEWMKDDQRLVEFMTDYAQDVRGGYDE